MKKLMLVVAMLLLGQASVMADVYQVDTNVSEVKWLATKITGRHDGTVAIASGEIELEGETLVGGTATIDMTSIKVSDISDEGTNQKLVGHLKSDDFFGVDEHPTATLKLKKVTGGENGRYTVLGSFKIKGKTAQVEFPVDMYKQGDTYVAKTEIKLDRTDFDVRYGSGKFFENLGDKTIHDEFTLEVEIEARKEL